jgi:predicted acylesterase/phospholipase RssA
MASSAFPLVYESTRLSANIIENGSAVGRSYEYIDGGFESVGGKNIPVLPAARSDKVDKIIVVYLKSADEINNSYTSLKRRPYKPL